MREMRAKERVSKKIRNREFSFSLQLTLVTDGRECPAVVESEPRKARDRQVASDDGSIDGVNDVSVGFTGARRRFRERGGLVSELHRVGFKARCFQGLGLGQGNGDILLVVGTDVGDGALLVLKKRGREENERRGWR